jgi:hypothetical protein
MRLSAVIALLCAAGLAAGALMLARDPIPRATVETASGAGASR